MSTPRDKAIAATQIVFEGQVLRVRDDGGTRYATIRTVRRVKGVVASVIEVATPVSSATCGYPFERGQRLTVGANLRERQLRTHSCVMYSLNAGAR